MAEIASYVISFIATIVSIITPFNKNMRSVLVFNFFINLLVGISYLLVKGNSGAIIYFVACVLSVINYIFSIKGKKIPIWLLVVYIITFAGVNLISYQHIYDLLALAASLCFVMSMAQSKIVYYRILCVINVFLWLLYDIFAHATGNLVTHTVTVLTLFVAIYVRDIRTKKKIENI